jgi:hypothetical protein
MARASFVAFRSSDMNAMFTILREDDAGQFAAAECLSGPQHTWEVSIRPAALKPLKTELGS